MDLGDVGVGEWFEASAEEVDVAGPVERIGFLEGATSEFLDRGGGEVTDGF